MAQVLEVTSEHNPGMHDSATGKSCVAEKVVDVTEDCPGADNKRRCVFLYTRDSRGRIVQMTRPYEGEEYMGMHVSFSVERLQDEMHVAPRDDTFGSWANRLGLTKPELMSLVWEHAQAK